MRSTPDPGPTSLRPPTSAAPTTFLDTLRGLGFTEQDLHPHAVHTTFRHGDGDRVVLVHCHPGDLAEPSDDGDCRLEIVCLDQGGHRDLWQSTISHLDELPLALTLLRAAAGIHD
jgi:predicted RNA binding protein YcfA (HicA-like mRNA interferase family)